MIDSAIAIALGYLLGAVPFGYLAGRLRGVDLRTEGSGSTGGTNAVRILGPKLGVPVILLDIFKGTAAVLVAGLFGGVGTEVLAATAAMIGHAFPVFLRFRGGKAVATGAGAMLGLAPYVAVAVIVIWLLVGVVTRYVSVASMIAAVAFVVLTVATGRSWPIVAFTLVANVVVFWRHRENIARLRSGTENRLNLPTRRGRAADERV